MYVILCLLLDSIHCCSLAYNFFFLKKRLQDCIRKVELKKSNRYVNANVIFYYNVLCTYDYQQLNTLLLIIILILHA